MQLNIGMNIMDAHDGDEEAVTDNLKEMALLAGLAASFKVLKIASGVVKRLARKWPRYPVGDPRFKYGCEKIADHILKIVGGHKYTVKPKMGNFLPELDGIGMGWSEHVVVVKDGKVYDAFTGHIGEAVDAYKARWTDSEYIDWPF